MRRTKILVTHYYDNIKNLVTNYLLSLGYDAVSFDDTETAFDYVRKHGLPDLAILDLHLWTSLFGFETAERLKSRGDVPIIFHSADSDTNLIIQALEEYAEDYIVFPYELAELGVRVERLLERYPPIPWGDEPMIQVDEHLKIHFGERWLIFSNRKGIYLTAAEAVLLSTLMRYAGQVVENRLLTTRAWRSYPADDTMLRAAIKRLKVKLVGASSREYIRTVGTTGYQFTVEPPR
jgi:two-component system, OmpR family, response regulator